MILSLGIPSVLGESIEKDRRRIQECDRELKVRRTRVPGEVKIITAAPLQQTLTLQQMLLGRCPCTGFPRKDKQGMTGFGGSQVVQTKYLVISSLSVGSEGHTIQ